MGVISAVLSLGQGRKRRAKIKFDIIESGGFGIPGTVMKPR
jgi:hypothetical protein